MTELTLSTPSILFSAISLILLAYTNRFLSYAQLVRTLKADYDKNPSTITRLQLANLRRRSTWPVRCSYLVSAACCCVWFAPF